MTFRIQSGVTHMDVTHMDESCYTCERVMSHNLRIRDISHNLRKLWADPCKLCMTHSYVMQNMCDMTHSYADPCKLTYKGLHMNESCHTYFA